MQERKSDSDWELPTVASLNFCDLIEAKMFNDRVVSINGEIEECGAGLVTNQFHVLAGSDEQITLLITSPGGAVDAGGAIIRAIRYAQARGCNVVGEVRGYAMSMAATILQACDLRLAAAEDIIMVHGFVGQSIGDIRNTAADMKLTMALTDVYSKFYAERSTSENNTYRSQRYWTKLLKDSLPRYMFGAEALEKGLIDEVI